MPKKTRDIQKEGVAVADSQTRNGNGKMERAATVSRRKKSASRKTAARKSEKLRKESSPRPKLDAALPLPSDEEIRVRAYFIAEKRAQLSLPGDNHSDWLEAKRQLLEEAGIR